MIIYLIIAIISLLGKINDFCNQFKKAKLTNLLNQPTTNEGF